MSKLIGRSAMNLWLKLNRDFKNKTFIRKDIYKYLENLSRTHRFNLINQLYSRGWLTGTIHPTKHSVTLFSCVDIQKIITEMEVE